MTRHDIRIRRGQFGSKRMQRHKDYSQLLSRHRKTNRLRWVIYIIVLLIAITLVVGLSYFSINKADKKEPESPAPTSLNIDKADL
jgi:flagellar basal body-associated protein FliL